MRVNLPLFFCANLANVLAVDVILPEYFRSVNTLSEYFRFVAELKEQKRG